MAESARKATALSSLKLRLPLQIVTELGNLDNNAQQDTFNIGLNVEVARGFCTAETSY